MSKKYISTNVNDFPVFGTLSETEYDCGIIDLIRPIEYCCQQLGYEWADIKYNKDYISDIIDLVQRRRVYFHVYHDIEMGELNEACLISFWILKLKPFYHAAKPDCKINLVIALALFTRAVNYTARAKAKKANLTEDIINHLIHAFTYRDLSKEAFMAIAESLIY